MARVIKHFEGNGTSTPYTVPAGKVAQIQGLITFVANTTSSFPNVLGNFRFGDTTVFMSAQSASGVHWTLNADTTHLQPVGLLGGGVTGISMRAGSTVLFGSPTGNGPAITFSGAATFPVSTSASFLFHGIPAPRIYIGAGDSLSFTQGTDAYIGFNIIAIEEDV